MSIVLGIIVGMSLGLIGGGGSIIAVPILMFGLGLPAYQAVPVSLASVGSTALFGALGRRSHLCLKTALTVALFGMIGSPIGAHAANNLPEHWLIGAFVILMVTIAGFVWRQSQQLSGDTSSRELLPNVRLRQMAISGLMIGCLSGLFGIGGGFLLVPILICLFGMTMYQAVSTALLSMVFICYTGVLYGMLSGTPVSYDLMLSFTIGGLIGMLIGTRLSNIIKETHLKKSFSLIVLIMAGLMVWHLPLQP